MICMIETKYASKAVLEKVLAGYILLFQKQVLTEGKMQRHSPKGRSRGFH